MKGSTMHPVAITLNKMASEMRSRFLERDDVIEMMFLALLARQHVFMIGTPGTSKSAMIRTLVNAIKNATYFEVAMSRNRVPEAVFGPYDLAKLRQENKLVRVGAGFAQSAHILNIEEIGKMNPILGHDMLHLLNERTFHEVGDDGLSVHPVPCSTAFTSANEHLTDDDEGNAALYDRLHLRDVVEEIKKPSNFAALLTLQLTELETTIEWADLHDVIVNEVPKVVLSDEAITALTELRKGMAEKSITVSSRRWREAVQTLRAAAFFAGRDTIYEEDVAALRFVLWETLPQREEVARLCTSRANPYVTRVTDAVTKLQAAGKTLVDVKDKSTADRAVEAKKVFQTLTAVRTDLDSMLESAQGRAIPKFKDASDLHASTLHQMFKVGFDRPDELIPQLMKDYLGKGDGLTADPAAQPTPAPAAAPSAPLPTTPPAPTGSSGPGVPDDVDNEFADMVAKLNEEGQ